MLIWTIRWFVCVFVQDRFSGQEDAVECIYHIILWYYWNVSRLCFQGLPDFCVCLFRIDKLIWQSIDFKMLVNAYIVLSNNVNLNGLFVQDGVRGGEDADELVHVPAVQVPAWVRGRASLHALPRHQAAGGQGARRRHDQRGQVLP